MEEPLLCNHDLCTRPASAVSFIQPSTEESPARDDFYYACQGNELCPEAVRRNHGCTAPARRENSSLLLVHRFCVASKITGYDCMCRFHGPAYHHFLCLGVLHFLSKVTPAPQVDHIHGRCSIPNIACIKVTQRGQKGASEFDIFSRRRHSSRRYRCLVTSTSARMPYHGARRRFRVGHTASFWGVQHARLEVVAGCYNQWRFVRLKLFPSEELIRAQSAL